MAHIVIDIALAATLAAGLTPQAQATEDTPPPEAARLLEKALPDGPSPELTDGRALFRAVLESDLFVTGTTGPFEVFVLADSGRRGRREAETLRDDLIETLEPASALVARLWPEGGEGLISGARLPLVVCDGEVDGVGSGELLSLLDHCEQLGFSGWAPSNAVDTAENRRAEVVRTWEVQLFDMQHPTIADRRDRWIEHGVGYYTLAFVANRALRRGAWGMVPPWLAHGLIDELDIEAYGEAWVGQESFIAQTPGWFRPGWSGFVPQGHRPPPPVTGPPANLAVTVTDTSDPWLSFQASGNRHWDALRVDRDSEAPMSFTRAAHTESFLPRDRAAARCLLHFMLAPSGREGVQPLTELLDREVKTPGSGMPDAEPLPVLFARALGGVPEVERLEGLTTRALLEELGRADLIALFESHEAQAALELADHREQARWLWRKAGYRQDARNALFQAFLEVEWEQQMAEWKAVAPHLDRGLEHALTSAKRYPKRAQDFGPIVDAFYEGVTQDPAAAAEAEEDSSRSKKKTSRSRRSRSCR